MILIIQLEKNMFRKSLVKLQYTFVKKKKTKIYTKA